MMITSPNTYTSTNDFHTSQKNAATAMERLSSGQRINSAADDAAGSAIVDRMTSQIIGLDQSIRNTSDTVTLVKTAEGSMKESGTILQRMRELSVQSSNDTNTSKDREYLQAEINQLQEELTRIAKTTEFNNQSLLDGTFTSKTFQIGANSGQHIKFSIGNMSSDKLGSHDLSLSGSSNQSVVNADKSTTVNTVSAAEDLTINGHNGTTTLDVLANATARDVANLVNGVSDKTGVTAEVTSKAKIDNVSAVGTFTLNVYGKNEGAVNISANITDVNDLTDLAQRLNEKTGTTGISAKLSDDKASITLTQDDGYDIVLEDVLETGGSAATIDFTGLSAKEVEVGAAGTLGAAAATDTGRVSGNVTMSSDKGYTVKSAATGGLMANTAANASTLSSVDRIDITTQSGSADAIKVIDGALSYVQGERSNLGAIQNRLDFTISNLENMVSNTTEARSNIGDTDYAKESSVLAKQQLLQQSSLAMLSMANASAEQIMMLLR